AYARDFGAGLAVQQTRAAAVVLSAPTVRHNNSADIVLDLLQDETLRRWSAFLTDLRVRPFDDPQQAVTVSGELGRANSPLAQLLLEVWQQAGGRDRGRTHAQQISIATAFGPMIQYVEQGRMHEVSDL